VKAQPSELRDHAAVGEGGRHKNLRLRVEYPGWGPDRIVYELGKVLPAGAVPGRSIVYRALIRALLWARPGYSPSRLAESSRISTLRILPVTVIGKSSTTMM
jgi:hypothetical protein